MHTFSTCPGTPSGPSALFMLYPLTLFWCCWRMSIVLSLATLMARATSSLLVSSGRRIVSPHKAMWHHHHQFVAACLFYSRSQCHSTCCGRCCWTDFLCTAYMSLLLDIFLKCSLCFTKVFSVSRLESWIPFFELSSHFAVKSTLVARAQFLKFTF